jgi:hypothetical protein
MALLNLAAFDQEDLAVISAHMQDAIVRLADIKHLRLQQQFVLVANRFAWEAERPERHRTGLRIARVLSVQSQRIRQGDNEAVLSLLSITFEEGRAPAGSIVLTCSGGGIIRVAVECIEVQMKDLGPAWTTTHQPQHEI